MINPQWNKCNDATIDYCKGLLIEIEKILGLPPI